MLYYIINRVRTFIYVGDEGTPEPSLSNFGKIP